MKAAFLHAIIVILTATVSAQQNNPNEASQPCGQGVDGIALCLSRSGEPDGLTLEVRNVGEKDAVFNLGMVLANGARQYPTAITLIFSTGGGPIPHGLAGPGVIAGRVDPFIMPLPGGAALTLSLHPSQYGWWFKDFSRDLKQYRVQAEFIGKGVSQAQNEPRYTRTCSHPVLDRHGVLKHCSYRAKIEPSATTLIAAGEV
jgi:hypothetical protein